MKPPEPKIDPAGLANDPGRRGDLAKAFLAGLASVDPYQATRAALNRTQSELVLGETAIRLTDTDRYLVLAFGKASIPMASAVVDELHGLVGDGVVVSNVSGSVEGLEVLAGSHPVPDQSSVTAAEQVLRHARTAGPRDVAVVAISGGGSALLTLPAGGIALNALAVTTTQLLRSGASIKELNTVRKHLSAIKGGRLAEALGESKAILTLILSDVVGNDLEVIASGPTVPDHSTYADALAVLDRYRVEVPPDVRDHLERGDRGELPETPTSGGGFDRQTIALVGDAASAAEGASVAARALGWETTVVDAEVEGEARDVARRVIADSRDLSPGSLMIYAGETTVTVVGDGSGGRNQELALAAGIEMDGDDGLVMLAAGTDGIDGMTQAAGGFADGESVARGRTLGMAATDCLKRNDSNVYLAAVGDLVVTGPTGTNVGDLILVARSG